MVPVTFIRRKYPINKEYGEKDPGMKGCGIKGLGFNLALGFGVSGFRVQSRVSRCGFQDLRLGYSG